MTKTLEISFRNHWKSIKPGIIFIVISIGLFLGHFFSVLGLEYDPIFINLGLLYSVLSFPVIYLHLTYYIDNRRLKIIIDSEAKKFILTKGRKTKEYNFYDIVHSERTLNIYHKNKIDGLARRITPWSGYNYIKFRLNDGTLFFVTSLMTDIRYFFDLGFKETHYSFFTPLLQRDWQTIDYSHFRPKE